MLISNYITPVFFNDPQGESVVWTIIGFIVLVLLIVDFIRAYVKSNEIIEEIDEKIESDLIEFDDFSTLSYEDKLRYIEQDAMMDVYYDKRRSIKLLNTLRLALFIPVKRHDKLGLTDEILEPSDVSPNYIYGLSMSSHDYVSSLGVYSSDPKYPSYCIKYQLSYEYWEEHYND